MKRIIPGAVNRKTGKNNAVEKRKKRRLSGSRVEVIETVAGKYNYSDDIEWVDVPAGTFRMGSRFGDPKEKPVHEVTLSAFRIAQTEVTVVQYRKCVKAGRCTAPKKDPDCNYGQKGRDNYPVNCVSRIMAAEFAAFVGGRLPTEAEWEYAAGLGRGTPKGRKYILSIEDYAGKTAPGKRVYTEIMDYAWFRSNSEDKCHPVATKKSSGIGLYDMLGNVMEWVSSPMSTYTAEPVTDPRDPADASMGVVRGGAWGSRGFETRVTHRQYSDPTATGVFLGFRPVIFSAKN